MPFKVNPKPKLPKESEKKVGFILSQVSTSNQLESKISEETSKPVIESVVPAKHVPVESKAIDTGVKRQKRPPKNIFDF